MCGLGCCRELGLVGRGEKVWVVVYLNILLVVFEEVGVWVFGVVVFEEFFGKLVIEVLVVFMFYVCVSFFYVVYGGGGRGGVF